MKLRRRKRTITQKIKWSYIEILEHTSYIVRSALRMVESTMIWDRQRKIMADTRTALWVDAQKLIEIGCPSIAKSVTFDLIQNYTTTAEAIDWLNQTEETNQDLQAQIRSEIKAERADNDQA